MAALATTSSLSNYPRLSISSYRDHLRVTQPDSLAVRYSYRGKQHSYTIHLSTTAPHYGGSRYWFNCPSCSKRVSVLYCAGLYVCRHCLSVPYSSQLQQPIDRLFSRVEAIRARLSWRAGIAHGYGAKPKGMHHSTYDRLLTEHDKLVQKICGVSMAMIEKIKGKASYN